MTESQTVGLLLHPLRPYAPADGFFAFANADTVWVEQSWLERRAVADCNAANKRFTVVKGKTLVIKLTRKVPNEVAVMLDGDYPLTFSGKLLSYALSDSTALPHGFTFHIYATPNGDFPSKNSPLIKTWRFTR